NDGFRVAMRAEPVPSTAQLRPQFLVVVDFAIEDDPDGRVFVVDRLLAGRQINDGQTSHAEADARHKSADLIVWAAAANSCAHPAQDCVVAPRIVAWRSPSVGDVFVCKTGYSAHSVRSALPAVKWPSCLSRANAFRSRCKSAAETSCPRVNG